MSSPSNSTSSSELANEIVDLQTRLAFQEQTIEELNQALTGQQRQLDAMQRLVTRLEGKIKDLQSQQPMMAPQQEPPPPHY